MYLCKHSTYLLLIMLQKSIWSGILFTNYKCANRFKNLLAHVSTDFQNQKTDFPSYLSGSDHETVHIINDNFKIYHDFVSEEEEVQLMDEINPIFKRRRYEYDHWDGAIHGYKETEKLKWNEANEKVLKCLREVAFPAGVLQLSQVHVLDLAKNGYIKPHIDSVRFCGDTIAGISLLSSCIMRLCHQNNKNKFVDILLNRRSLYVMTGVARYSFTHEILDEKNSVFKQEHVPRDRRISVICRNKPKNEDSSL